MKYRPSPDFVLALVIILALTALAVYLVAAIHGFEASKGRAQVTQSVTRVHLPTRCRPYYNDGTDRWINCMGVGYK